jgi:hypothetical protein
LTALARGVREAIRGPGPTATPWAPAAGVDAGVTELHRVVPRPSTDERPRLNLLLPTLEAGRRFGGANTALDLFDTIAPAFPRRRIVAFTPVTTDAAAALDGFRLANADDDPPDERIVVAAPRGGETTLTVGAGDVFLATFWTTAEQAIRLVRRQAGTFDALPKPFAYLIQDYEPGFYPWSAQSELARGTYALDVPTIAVVNSGLLGEYLTSQGIRFERQFTFEPRLSPALRALIAEPPRPRQRRVVVYGRPETPRNAFPLIVDGLRAWVRGGGAGGWEFVSAGRAHAPVDLRADVRLRSLGKLEIAAYGALLRESAIGVSLMVSPHPSYPPLEMAHLGLRVITNRFGPKDLAAWHENIHSLEGLSAEGIAAALIAEAAAFDEDPGAGDAARPLGDDYLADGPLFPFASDLATALLAGS